MKIDPEIKQDLIDRVRLELVMYSLKQAVAAMSIDKNNREKSRPEFTKVMDEMMMDTAESIVRLVYNTAKDIFIVSVEKPDGTKTKELHNYIREALEIWSRVSVSSGIPRDGVHVRSIKKKVKLNYGTYKKLRKSVPKE